MEEPLHVVLATGTELGRYVIESRLGAGGMGEVDRAREQRLRRTAALNVLPTRLASTPGLRSCGPPGATSSNYNVTADGKRFLMIKDEARDKPLSRQIVVAQGWTGELERMEKSKGGQRA